MGRPRTRRRDQVSALLTAACAPPRSGELAGEEAAVAAYRAAGSAPPSPAPSRPGRDRRFTAGPTTWLAAVVATAAAGATFAAVSHEFPSGDPRPQRVTAPTVSGASTPDGTSTTRANAAPGRDGGPARGPDGGPGKVPSMAALCRAYLAHERADRARALRTPAFRQLVEVAGGAEGVPGYCDQSTAQVPNDAGPENPAPANRAPADRAPESPRLADPALTDPGAGNPRPPAANPAPTDLSRGKTSDRSGKG